MLQKEGALRITYDDPIIREAVTLDPDMIVVEEAIEASPANADLAEMLRFDLSPSGFIQTDNVHRYPVSTNREGIYVVGASREINNLSDAWMDPDNAALQIDALLGNRTKTESAGTTLDAGKCTFCLTCYRCCPHGAIYRENDSNTIISLLMCQGCGICAAECPMDAIHIGRFSDAQMHAQIKESAAVRADSQKINAFCCQNSALKKDAQRMLSEIGMQPSKLRFAALAANMGSDFAGIVNEMAADLKAP